MRSTLFFIPFEIGGAPLFGFGVLLAIWAIVCAVTLFVIARRHGVGREMAEFLPAMAIFGAAIYFLPRVFAQYGGMPVRGYGVMVVLGATAGIGIAARRARRMGLNPEIIVSVCFWMIVAGIVGARVFYVAQYWSSDFQAPTLGETMQRVVNYTYGGLVIYGAIFGGAAAFLWYAHRHQLPALAMADLIAPGVVLGIALGRVGCFLHGCCFGGVCELPWAVTFPAGSPPYERQAFDGQIPTIDLAFLDDGKTVVRSAPADSPAHAAGLRTGDVLASINGAAIEPDGDAHAMLLFAAASGDAIRIGTARGDFTISAGALPARSRPVHPTQIYSAIHAAALTLVLWFFYPYRRRDGEVLAALMILYPIGRFVLESVRTDEAGRFGTSLTISQWISIVVAISGVALWGAIQLRAAEPALPPALETR